MEVVLLKASEHLGDKGAVVNVSAGYARNFLFPSRLAREVDAAMKLHLQAIAKQQQKKLDRARTEKAKEVQQIESKSYAVTSKASDNGKLFGTITTAQIAELITKESGLKVDKRKVSVDGGVKKIGEFEVIIKYHPGLEAKVKLKVTREAEGKK